MEEIPQSPTTEDVAKPPVAPTTLGQPEFVSDPAVRFRGLGTNFKAKLIGIDEVSDSRGDNMCQESILKLKAARKVSGEHKQKITINVSLEGIKIVDVLSGEVHHVHPVHRISFISRDLTDRRAFGYVYGAGEGRHQFFGIKTAKVAEMLVLALRDLFQVVYDMKKKEMEEAKTVNGSKAEVKESEDVYAVSTKKAPVPAERKVQSTGSMLDLETQLTNIQEGINNIDSFNSPWGNEGPTSPETPFSPSGEGSSSDLFGIAANPPNTAPQKNSSYSDELFALDAPAAQPAPQPGAKLTKDQILMGYGGAPHPGMVPGPQQMMPPGAQMPGQYGVQPQMTQGFPQQVGGFGQPAASAPYGMFPTGPSPAIPPRPGAMRPPVQQLAPGGAPQNPFGDAASVGVNSGGLLAPSNSMPAAAGGGDTTASTGKSAPSDPFANLIPGMGGSSTTSKKDMFKNFEMAKPPQPPPRTNVPPSNGTASIPNQDQAPMSDFDNYFIKNVGGIPIAEKEAPVATPRSNNAEANDPFGISLDQGPTTNQAVDDPFASRGAFTEPFQFNQTTDNSQSLFGI